MAPQFMNTRLPIGFICVLTFSTALQDLDFLGTVDVYPGNMRQYFTILIIKTLLFYSIWYRLCVSSFGSFSIFPFSRLIPGFYSNISTLYARIPCYVFSTCSTAHGARVEVGEGSHEWCGGVPCLIHVLNQGGGLIYQPDSWLWISVRLPLPQGTGESSSADHS